MSLFFSTHIFGVAEKGSVPNIFFLINKKMEKDYW